MKIDLHVHSEFSPDSQFSLDHIVTLSEQLGLPVICITDHDSVDGCLKLREGYPRQPILPGMELGLDEGDFLVYSLDLDRLRSILGKHVKSVSGLERSPELAIVWAHPLSRRFRDSDCDFAEGEGLRRVMDHIDGIEVYNSKMLIHVTLGQESAGYADNLIQIAQKFGKAAVGSSDAHQFYNYLKCWTEVPPEYASAAGVIEAIRKGLTTPEFDPLYLKRLTDYLEKSARL